MSAVPIVALVLLVVAANALWLLSIRYAAQRWKVDAPSGDTYDVLVHRDGVMLYTRAAGFANAYTILPTLVAVVRHGRRRPWRWVVRVRRSPFGGQRDLLREVLADGDAASERAEEISGSIKSGTFLWPMDSER